MTWAFEKVWFAGNFVRQQLFGDLLLIRPALFFLIFAD
jgi:hypothetical protein